GGLGGGVGGRGRPRGGGGGKDGGGVEGIDAGRRAGVGGPDEVGVIGVDNDEILCTLSNPPLSSVDIDAPRIGYEAAALLSRMMAGKPAPVETVLLAPRGVVARASTDVLATADRDLAGAIRFLREHAWEGLRSKELARRAHLARRTLERRVYQLLGRSPKEEMMRIRLERAKQLLTETDLPVGAIAKKCGFSGKYFSQAFQAKLGLTPGRYRHITQT